MVDPELLQILACPACHGGIKLVKETVGGKEVEKLVCQNPLCGLRFPVRDDIPVMLIEEAEKPKRNTLSA